MTCPACGARNGDRASWCTQCYASLSERPEVGEASADRDRASNALTAGPEVVADPAGGDGPPPLPPGAADPAPRDRDVRVRDDEVEWRCAACGGWTSLFEPTCTGCGGPRAGFTPPDVAAEQAPRGGVGISVVAGALLPGLGHLLRGTAGLGVAVLLLWTLWAGGAVASLGGAGALTAVLLLAAASLWAAALVDLWQRANGGAAVLSGQVLAWATVAVTGLLVLVAIGGGLGTRG